MIENTPEHSITPNKRSAFAVIAMLAHGLVAIFYLLSSAGLLWPSSFDGPERAKAKWVYVAVFLPIVLAGNVASAWVYKKAPRYHILFTLILLGLAMLLVIALCSGIITVESSDNQNPWM